MDVVVMWCGGVERGVKVVLEESSCLAACDEVGEDGAIIGGGTGKWVVGSPFWCLVGGI